jgi:hypothetical protein
VENDHPIVGAEAKIALDPCPGLERGGEGNQAVLGERRAIVKASMGEPIRPGIERVRA